MVEPWVIEPDSRSNSGQNGDVIVRQRGGRMIALFYAGPGRDGEKVARARAVTFCKVASPQWCSWCGCDTVQGDECDRCRDWWASNGPATHSTGEA